MSIFSISYFTSDTSAFFNDVEHVDGSIQVGEWEIVDKGVNSFLIFPNNLNEQSMNSCGPSDISVSILNSGINMDAAFDYEVFFSATGNPIEGENVGRGVINLIESSENTLTYTATTPGNYKFKVYHGSSLGNNTPRLQESWSEAISIICDKNQNSEEKEKTEDSKPNDESKSSEESSDIEKPIDHSESDKELDNGEENNNRKEEGIKDESK